LPDILVRNISKKTIDQLKARAKRHNRSLQEEVKHLIEITVKVTGESALIRARKIRASFGTKTFSDSAGLLREDRS
jgi:hypothetical protein